MFELALPLMRTGRGQGFTVYFAARGLADYFAAHPAHPMAMQRVAYLAAARDAIGYLERWSTFAGLTLTLVATEIAEGEYDRALAHIREALDPLDPADPYGPTLLQTAAQIHNVRDAWDEALTTLADADAAVARVEAARRDPAKDETPSDTAKRERVRAANRIESARIAGVRADVYLRMGLLDQAAAWLTRELAGLAEAELAPEGLKLRAQIHRANLWLALDRFDDLVRDLDALFEKHDDLRAYPAERFALSVRRAVALSVRERRDGELEPTKDRAREPRAEAALRELLDSDRSQDPLEARTVRMHLARLLAADGRIDEARELVERMLEAGSLAPRDDAELAALDLELHLRRARTTNTTARVPGDALRAAMRERLERLEIAYARIVAEWSETGLRRGGVGFLQFENVRRVMARLIEGALWLDGEPGRSRAIDRLLEAQAVSTLARRLRAPDPSLDRLRARLAPAAGFLLYLPTDDTTHVFAVDADGIVHEQGASRPAIEALRRPWVDRVTRAPLGLDGTQRRDRIASIRDGGVKLAEAILPGAIRDRIRTWSSVTILAPELLGYLPFECLPTSDASWLGLDRAISYAPSGATVLALAVRRQERLATRDETAGEETRSGVAARFVVAPSTNAAAGDRPQIPFDSRIESTLGASAYTAVGLRIDQLARAEASLADLRRVQRDDSRVPRVTHFVVHGIHDYERVPTSGLLLAPSRIVDSEGQTTEHDGRTWADDLGTLAASPCMMLSACGTGRGPARWGDDDASNLAGVFLAGGADTVVLPYAELELGSGLRLGATFHERVVQGASATQAMLDARRRLVEDARYADPFFFGLLHVRGLGDAAPFPERARRDAGGEVTSHGDTAADSSDGDVASRGVLGVTLLAFGFVVLAFVVVVAIVISRYRPRR